MLLGRSGVIGPDGLILSNAGRYVGMAITTVDLDQPKRIVLGVLDHYFENEHLFRVNLVRFSNVLAERSDLLLKRTIERTRALGS